MYVTHGIWTQHITVRNLGEMFTLSSELPFLADLVFQFHYYSSASCHVIPCHQDFKVHSLNEILFKIINLTCLTCLLHVPVHYTSQLHIQSEMHMWWTPHMKNLRFTPLCAAPTSCKRLTQLKQLDVLCRIKNIHVLYYRFRPNSAFIIHS